MPTSGLAFTLRQNFSKDRLTAEQPWHFALFVSDLSEIEVCRVFWVADHESGIEIWKSEIFLALCQNLDCKLILQIKVF